MTRAAAIAEAERRRVTGQATPVSPRPVNRLQQIAAAYARGGKMPPASKPSPAQQVHAREMQRWSGLTTRSTYRPARGDDGCS